KNASTCCPSTPPVRVGFSRADPGGRGTPRFRHRLIRFRHFIRGSLALASLNLACRDHVPTFPQRSPPLVPVKGGFGRATGAVQDDCGCISARGTHREPFRAVPYDYLIDASPPIGL